MKFLQIKNLSFNYVSYDEETEAKTSYKAIDNVSLDIEQGSFVAILGHNGSGKSTLAKHLSGILKGYQGEVLVDGLSTTDENNIWDIRKTVGTVFQNPDNQLVASIVEDDVAFGPENLGIDREEIKKRIDFALKSVNMEDFRYSQTSSLSGGQKQRVAIAGILAMEPKCIVLDEPTAMLDPKGRKEVIETIKKLNKEKGITIVLITHYMEEVIDADRLIIMEKGKIVLDDIPLNVFKNVEKIRSLKLDVPDAIDIIYNLNKQGYNIPMDILSIEDLAKRLIHIGFKENNYEDIQYIPSNKNDEIIKLQNIKHIYSKSTVFERLALDNINITINKGDFLGIIGHTGSGKSTLIQIFNALIKPTLGNVYVNREEIYSSNKPLKDIRQKVGVVFQYPEYQLFEETVYKDVAFAPTNMGLPKEEIDKRVKDALNTVFIDESYYNKSPFELSGGEKRRVAIAGILTMKPDILVFDELTAGLDPYGREEMLTQIKSMQHKLNTTIVLVSHSMDDVSKTCDRVIVLNKGNIVLNDVVAKVFENGKTLESIGLDIPKCSKLFHILNEKGYNFNTNIYTIDECVKVLNKNLNKC
ncbi:energy-coupling factor transporter ATPase [uncultured Tyzzerella sp.]|uniref:energy-coupling factor transporter ATPase n=1 Tax=uncultured Tyzzerella sp. TaxID=2321398 RepID=UPI0029429973|nr:energy-coupling factor transporter ATPase [uncultured Tyzzerella sp.]